MSPGNDGSIRFPAGLGDDWIFRSSVSQQSAMVGSIAWTPTLFSSVPVILDANEFQSDESADLLRTSEATYDWDKLRAIVLENEQL